MKTIVAGEYDCVSQQTINIVRLRTAHNTPCTEDKAYVLLAVMHDKHFPNTPLPLVRFRAPRAGKYSARGWGGVKSVKSISVSSGKVESIRRGYVSLPKTPYSGIGHPFGFLRVGLVIHEYAHAFEMLKFGKSNHGARFTMILDMLLHETELFWRRAEVNSVK